MSEVKGMLVTCNRCGYETFLKYLGRGDLDGGYDTYDKFERLSSDWLFETQIGHLCPRCAMEFKKFVTSFMGVHPVAPAWRFDGTETIETI